MNRFMWILTALSRIVLAGVFWVSVRLFHEVEIHGLDNAKSKHPAYFAMAHKRDLDPLVEVPSVLTRRGWRALAGDVLFALRGDAFLPGFLGHIVSRPRWLARFLRLLSLGTILRGLGIRPLENLYVRPTDLWLHEWLAAYGDMRIGEVLTQGFVQHIAAMSGENSDDLQVQPLSHLLSWRYHEALKAWYSADIFSASTRRLAKQEALRKLKEQLAELSTWLSRGGTLWGAAEGKLSPDGTLSPITAILYRLLQTSPLETCIIPISITYDFMTVRRPRIFVRLAPPIEQASLLTPRHLEKQLRDSWLLGTYFTCSHLASGFLVQKHGMDHPSFTLDDLVIHIHELAVSLKAANRCVDQRLLYPDTARKLAQRFLQYAHHQDLVHHIGSHKWVPKISNLTIKVPPGDVGYEQAPLAYAWNELQEISTPPTPTTPRKTD
jgi:hypothetical protein